MKKIIGLSIAALLVIGLVGGGTFAYFSDAEASTGNTFTAGTLNLVPLTAGTGVVGKYLVTPGGDGLNGNVVFSNMAPGETGSITWTLSNTGSLSGNLTMTGSTVSFTDGVAAVDPEASVIGNNAGDNGDLDEFVGVKLFDGTTYLIGNAASYAPMSGLESVILSINKAIPASGSVDYTLSWSIASYIFTDGGDGLFDGVGDVDVDDNIIQGDNATLDIAFTLTQN